MWNDTGQVSSLFWRDAVHNNLSPDARIGVLQLPDIISGAPDTSWKWTMAINVALKGQVHCACIEHWKLSYGSGSTVWKDGCSDAMYYLPSDPGGQLTCARILEVGAFVHVMCFRAGWWPLSCSSECRTQQQVHSLKQSAVRQWSTTLRHGDAATSIAASQCQGSGFVLSLGSLCEIYSFSVFIYLPTSSMHSTLYLPQPPPRDALLSLLRLWPHIVRLG